MRPAGRVFETPALRSTSIVSQLNFLSVILTTLEKPGQFNSSLKHLYILTIDPKMLLEKVIKKTQKYSSFQLFKSFIYLAFVEAS